MGYNRIRMDRVDSEILRNPFRFIGEPHPWSRVCDHRGCHNVTTARVALGHTTFLCARPRSLPTRGGRRWNDVLWLLTAIHPMSRRVAVRGLLDSATEQTVYFGWSPQNIISS